MCAATPNDRSAVSTVSAWDVLREYATAAATAGATGDRWYDRAIQSIPAAVCICDEFGSVRWFNRRAVELVGRPPNLEKHEDLVTWFQAAPGPSRIRLEELLRDRQSGREIELTLERDGAASARVSITIEPIGNIVGSEGGFIVVAVDQSERTRPEHHARMLGRLAEELLGAESETDVVRTAARLVGQHLGVQRCGFVEPELSSGKLKVLSGWTRELLPTLAGHYDPESLGDEEWRRAIATSLVAIKDVAVDPRTRGSAEYYGTQGIRAYAAAPLVRSGQWVATIVVTQAEPRSWAPEELSVLQYAITRIWPLVERMRAQTALQLMSTHAPVVLAHLDRDSRIKFANLAFAARWGVATKEVIGQPLAEVIGEEAFAMLTPFIARVLAGESVQLEQQMPYRRIGDRYVQISCSPDRGEDGEVRGFFTAVSDLTDRRAMEQALRESEERFRVVASRAPVGIFMADPYGRTVFVNASWCAMAGLTPEEAQGFGWAQAIHPEDRERVAANWEHAVQHGTSSKAEFRFVRRDGSVTWVHGVAVQLRDGNGHLTGYIGTVADFTERKQVELALRESEEKRRRAQEELTAHAGDLERKVEARTASLRDAIAQMEEFSYSVSHDLRAPLRAMNAYAEALMEDYGAKLDDTARDYLRRIQRSSQRMEKLTYDVLTYSRLARLEMVLTKIELAPILQDLIGQYAELQPPSAEVTLEYPLLPVRGHESSIGQVLGNLLTNAAKFVAPGVKPQIRVFTTNVGTAVRISIVDNGIGIAPEHQPRLFQVFERVPTLVPDEGTGIGLAIVRKAVEKMGGRYGVESDGRTGTCFWIELPKP